MADEEEEKEGLSSSSKKFPLQEILGGILIAVALFIIIMILFPSNPQIKNEACGAGSAGLRSVWPSRDGGSLFMVVENFGNGQIKHDEAMPIAVSVSGDTSSGKFEKTLNTTYCAPTFGWHDVLEPLGGNYTKLIVECGGLGLNASLESMLKSDVTLSCGAKLKADVVTEINLEQ